MVSFGSRRKPLPVLHAARHVFGNLRPEVQKIPQYFLSPEPPKIRENARYQDYDSFKFFFHVCLKLGQKDHIWVFW